MAEPQGSFPQWVITPLTWIVIFFASIITGTVGWFVRLVWTRLTKVEMTVSNLELRMAPMVSRAELVAYMQQMRDDFEKHNQKLRDDQQRLHQENRDDAAATRNDIRAVHDRVDQLFKR